MNDAISQQLCMADAQGTDTGNCDQRDRSREIKDAVDRLAAWEPEPLIPLIYDVMKFGAAALPVLGKAAAARKLPVSQRCAALAVIAAIYREDPEQSLTLLERRASRDRSLPVKRVAAKLAALVRGFAWIDEVNKRSSDGSDRPIGMLNATESLRYLGIVVWTVTSTLHDMAFAELEERLNRTAGPRHRAADHGHEMRQAADAGLPSGTH